MTLEGCVVRLTDTIAYIGQDIEDAIRVGLITREDIPPELRESLGSTNGEIIDSLVKDVVYNSYNKPYVCFSAEVSEQLLQLKKFNYEKIYFSPFIKKDQEKIERGFQILFEKFLEDLKKGNQDSHIYRDFLNTKHASYLDSTSEAEKVRDFIGGMTDRYFVEVLRELVIPEIGLFNKKGKNG